MMPSTDNLGEVEMDEFSLDPQKDDHLADISATPRKFERFHRLCLTLSTPISIWMYFTGCNFLNYVDRGAFAGSISDINSEFGLSETQGGLLGGTKYLISKISQRGVEGERNLNLKIIVKKFIFSKSLLHAWIHHFCSFIRSLFKKIQTSQPNEHRTIHLVYCNYFNRFFFSFLFFFSNFFIYYQWWGERNEFELCNLDHCKSHQWDRGGFLHRTSTNLHR